ncbi:MAG: hypothetical protein KAG66_25065, partial [Methylococcales bacterium]|nr:hypothetical protein [Methylococcales bacterium]
AGFSFAGIAALSVREAAAGQWQAESRQQTLADGSVLTEYYGFTTAADLDNGRLRIGFVPRFGCSPIIGVEIEQDPALASKSAAVPLPDKSILVDGDRLTLVVDREPVEFPLAVDGDKQQTRLWFNGGLEDRKALHSKLDLGNVAELALTSETAVAFSLLGSKSVVDAAQNLCRAHEPLPYEKQKSR